MTRPIQKIEEQNYANLAAKLLKENWQISEPENELDWPDLLVKNGAKYFGLEVLFMTVNTIFYHKRTYA